MHDLLIFLISFLFGLIAGYILFFMRDSDKTNPTVDAEISAVIKINDRIYMFRRQIRNEPLSIYLSKDNGYQLLSPIKIAFDLDEELNPHTL